MVFLFAIVEGRGPPSVHAEGMSASVNPRQERVQAESVLHAGGVDTLLTAAAAAKPYHCIDHRTGEGLEQRGYAGHGGVLDARAPRDKPGR